MSIEKKSLISNRRTITKANLTKVNATQVSSTKAISTKLNSTKVLVRPKLAGTAKLHVAMAAPKVAGQRLAVSMAAPKIIVR